MPEVNNLPPSEVAGRDTIARFGLQFQAAAYASLAILKNGDIDRVYCDWHDDFVVRRTTKSGRGYHFHQVKTKSKANAQWKMLEVFALKKKGAQVPEEIANSFAGKLFVHSIVFGDACLGITFLTNIQCQDDLLSLVEELKTSTFTSAQAKFLADKFTAIFSNASSLNEEDVKAALAKFDVQPGVKHIGFDGLEFTSAAREAIHQFSEIDLSRDETAKIARGLVELAHRKSQNIVLSGMTPAELDNAVSIGLEDLLDVLCISPDSYEILRKGGDEKALKHASVIQRLFEGAGAPDNIVEYLSEQKVAWDVWVRRNRHDIPEFDFVIISAELSKAHRTWARGGHDLSDLTALVAQLKAVPLVQRYSSLTDDILVGGLLAVLVKERSR